MQYRTALRPDATGQTPSATRETIAQYRKTAARLARACAVDLVLVGRDATPFELAGWFAGRHGRWAASTIRLYRRSLEYDMQIRRVRGELNLFQAARLALSIFPGPTPKVRRSPSLQSPRTASSKRRFIDSKTARAIFERATCAKGSINRILALYIKYNSYFGLRPQEWTRAKVRLRCLVVCNAKCSNGRANGKRRPISLKPFTNAQIGEIRQLIDLTQAAVSERGSWRKLNHALAARLQRICRALKIPRVCLYSLRGTATARIKASGAGASEVAAFLGHAANSTAQRHYPSARGAAGWSPVCPRVGRNAIRRVRQTYSPPQLLRERLLPTSTM